jgi:hypothetical protein
MIFRRLERKHAEEAFGQYLSPAQLDDIVGGLSEWSCFKMTISRWRWGPLGPLRRNIDPATLAAVLEAESKQATVESKGDQR